MTNLQIDHLTARIADMEVTLDDLLTSAIAADDRTSNVNRSLARTRYAAADRLAINIDRDRTTLRFLTAALIP